MRIAASALSDILHHARETAPCECCGLLVGSGDSVVRTVRAANLEAAPTRYSIDPIDHFRAIRGARADGLEVVGAYHSHPASAAIPSATDIAEATSGADFVYLIVSLVDEDVRAYRIDEGTAVRIPLQAA